MRGGDKMSGRGKMRGREKMRGRGGEWGRRRERRRKRRRTEQREVRQIINSSFFPLHSSSHPFSLPPSLPRVLYRGGTPGYPP